MKSSLVLSVFMLLLAGCSGDENRTYTVETVNGVRHVHNLAPQWGDTPAVSLEFVQRIGSLETGEENFQFYQPSDLGLDGEGNIHLLDSGNHRVLVFSPDGAFLRKWGRQGEGPGEFRNPSSMQLVQGVCYLQTVQRLMKIDRTGVETGSFGMDDNRYMSVALPNGRFISTRSGMSADVDAQIREKLFRMYSPEGTLVAEFGDKRNYGDLMINSIGNRVYFAINAENGLFAAYAKQNRIEKYSADGEQVFVVDRPAPFAESEPEPVRRSGANPSSSSGGERVVVAVGPVPQMNTFSKGIQVDGSGRIWIWTATRQRIRDRENPENNVDEESTLDVFSPDGILLGQTPLPEGFTPYMFRIFGDQLFFIDRNDQMSVFEYRISG